MLTFPDGVTRFFNYNQAGRMVADILQDANDWVFMTYYSYDQHGRRVINILDRKFTTATAPPIFTPQNDEGNPVIPTGNGTPQIPITDYDVTSYPAETWVNAAKDTNYTIYHLEKTGGGGPDEKVYAENGSSTIVGIQGDLSNDTPSAGQTQIELRDASSQTLLDTYNLTGSWSEAPTGYAGTNLLKDTTPAYDYANAVVQEGVDEQGASLSTDDYDRGKECCGKLAMSNAGAAVASEKSGRAMIKQQMSFEKGLKAGGSGNMNQISEPWATLIDDDGGAPDESQLAIVYTHPDCWEMFNDYAEFLEHIRNYHSKQLGRLSKITKLTTDDPPVETTEAEFSYDNYGRMTQAIDRTQDQAVTKDYHNDWQTGNMDLEDDGTTTRSHNHGPGFTRGNKDLGPGWEVEWWMYNGLSGNGKWSVDSNGVMQRYYGYSSWGNNIQEEQYNGAPAQKPKSMGGDTRPIDSYDQMTVGNSVSNDSTPMVGALDSPPASGAQAGGNNGNPDVAGIFPGVPSEPFPWEEWHLPSGPYPWETPGSPGTGTPDAPANAPNGMQDTSTQADRRLAGMWPEQEYYGPKPGQQTGSMGVNDNRDIRQPLAVCGWCEAVRHAEDVEGSGFFAGPPPPGHRLPGSFPMIPNPSSQTEMAGITTNSYIGDIEIGPYYPDLDNPIRSSEIELREMRERVL